MKKTFKKIAAAVMAVATLAVGMTGMTASATEGSRSFSPNSTASLAVTTTYVSSSTRCTKTCSVITAQTTSTSGATITSGNSIKSAYNATSVYATGYGNGFTMASSYHYSKTTSGSSGSTSLTVSK